MGIEQTFTITPRGPFSLAEAGGFGRSERGADWPGAGVFSPAEGILRLAFCADGMAHQVGVALSQEPAGIRAVVSGLPPGEPVTAIRDQVARMLSLDADASGLAEVAARDPVIGRVLAAAPGLRPVLFAGPYEAALWCVIAQRWGTRQAAAARERLARSLGRSVTVAGVELAVVPLPGRLLAAQALPGLPEVKQARLRAVARAAAAGALDAAAIREGEPEVVRARLREIPGIGPFAAALIHLRASGVRDVPVEADPRLAALVGALYRLGGPASPVELAHIAEAWRPWRTWMAVLLRAAGRRLPELADLPEPAPPPRSPGGSPRERAAARERGVRRIAAAERRLALVS